MKNSIEFKASSKSDVNKSYSYVYQVYIRPTDNKAPKTA